MADVLSGEFSEAFKVALEHHQAGRLAEAEKIYRQILAHHPHHPDTLHLLGLIAYQVQRYDPAIDLITRAIALDNYNPVFHSNLGEALRAAGRLDDAIISLERALALRGDNARVRSKPFPGLHRTRRKRPHYRPTGRRHGVVPASDRTRSPASRASPQPRPRAVPTRTRRRGDRGVPLRVGASAGPPADPQQSDPVDELFSAGFPPPKSMPRPLRGTRATPSVTRTSNGLIPTRSTPTAASASATSRPISARTPSHHSWPDCFIPTIAPPSKSSPTRTSPSRTR
jgi:hypothetical protein